MQVLCDSSEEGPGEGLGFIPARVRRLGHPRLPHIGWNSVRHGGKGIFEGVDPEARFYFVHSYAPPEGSPFAAASADYGGRFAAAASRANVWAVQFHPEKSSAVGHRVVENFVSFAGRCLS